MRASAEVFKRPTLGTQVAAALAKRVLLVPPAEMATVLPELIDWLEEKAVDLAVNIETEAFALTSAQARGHRAGRVPTQNAELEFVQGQVLAPTPRAFLQVTFCTLGENECHLIVDGEDDISVRRH